MPISTVAVAPLAGAAARLKVTVELETALLPEKSG